jgi:hypothetical protein
MFVQRIAIASGPGKPSSTVSAATLEHTGSKCWSTNLSNVMPPLVRGKQDKVGVVYALFFRIASVLFECLVEEEREVLQEAELSGELTQRTTSEAPQTIGITLGWT